MKRYSALLDSVTPAIVATIPPRWQGLAYITASASAVTFNGSCPFDKWAFRKIHWAIATELHWERHWRRAVTVRATPNDVLDCILVKQALDAPPDDGGLTSHRCLDRDGSEALNLWARGLSLEQIGRATGRKAGTIKSRLRVAKAKLRKALHVDPTTATRRD